MFKFSIAILLFLSPILLAEEKIEGFILKKADATSLVHKGKAYHLEVTNYQDMIATKALENGDFVIGTGLILEDRIQMDAVHFVGLRKLIGLWRSEDWELFEFRNFEDLLLLWPAIRETTGIPGTISPLKTKSYNYTIAPAPSPFWSMILVSDETVDLARITFYEEKLVIELLHRDMHQDEIQRTFVLSPLSGSSSDLVEPPPKALSR